MLTIATHGTCWENTTTRETMLALPASYCTSWSVPLNLCWPQIPVAAPAWDTSTLPGRVCLLGDRAVPTENFCNIKCLQPQDRKMVIKSLTALMIQGFYASHPRATAWLQHHKPQMCFTHGSSSASWENPHCKWGHWGVGRSSHPPKTSQAGSNLSARCLP